MKANLQSALSVENSTKSHSPNKLICTMKYTHFFLIYQTSFLKKVLRACIPCWGLLIPIISVLRTNPHTDYSCVNELKWDHCGTGTFFIFLLSQRFSEARKHLVHKLPLICTEIFQASLTIIKVPFSKCSCNYYTLEAKSIFHHWQPCTFNK